jgi:aminopeptidase N
MEVMPTQDPHSYADFVQGALKHISFEIQVDFRSRALDIVATYTLERAAHGPLYLDSRELDIRRIHCDGVALEWSLDRQDPILGDRLHIHDMQGNASFTIEWKTSPTASALQWLNPDQTAGKVHPFLYSQCQALHARSIFPCQDTPAVRFTYDAQMRVRSPLVAVMAAAQINREEGGEYSLSNFQMPQPIPSYLFAFAVGNLVFRAYDERTGIFAEPELIDAGEWEFAGNPEKLRVAEELFGPYLWDRYDVLIMPPSFPYGGMENPRLTFLNPLYILGDRSWTSIVSHELAHAWTGNLVTNANWDHFWLNEGWTSYADLRLTEAIEGFDAAQLDAAVNIDVLGLDLERFGMGSDITRLRTSLTGINPDDTFSRVPYYKGAAFFRAAEAVVGRARFDRFVQTYIETFRFCALTTEDFLDFMGAQLPEVFDSLDIDAWIYKPGLPEAAYDNPSALHDQARRLVTAYEQGHLPSRDQVADWRRGQVLTFLLGLPQKIPLDHCQHLDEVFRISHERDPGLQCLFFRTAVHSEFKEALPWIEAFFEKIGRHSDLALIFRAMVKESWSQPEARPLLERVRHLHHPITIQVLDGILAEAGL